MSYKKFTHWASFSLELLDQFHEIFTRYRGIICAVNAHIEVAISHSVSEWQSDKCSGVGNFTTKLVAMTTSLKISEKEGQIDHLQSNIYHTVQRLWKSVQQILRYFGSQWNSLLRQKIGCHGNVPWGIGKTGPDRVNFSAVVMHVAIHSDFAQISFSWIVEKPHQRYS